MHSCAACTVNRLVCFQILDRFPRKYLPISATGSCHADEADESQSVLDVLGDGEVSEGAIPPFQLWRSVARPADVLVESIWRRGLSLYSVTVRARVRPAFSVTRFGSSTCDVVVLCGIVTAVTLRSGASRCERLGTRTTC